jgi:hypothetical protein
MVCFSQPLGNVVVTFMNSELKDLFLFACLVALLLYGYQKARTYINIHTNTLVHELDHNFIDRLYSVQRQVRVTQLLFEHLPDNSSEAINALLSLTKTLSDIEEKYSSNSQGVMFLGPIGSTAIILKEQELENRLVMIAQEVGSFLRALSKQPYPAELQSSNIDTLIAQNQKYISQLLKK